MLVIETAYIMMSLQFEDIGMSGLSVAKGNLAVCKKCPEKVNPEWDEDADKVTPMMWTGASVKIL